MRTDTGLEEVEIVYGNRRNTGETALRLAKYSGTSDDFWINLQGHDELGRAEDAAGERFAAIALLQVA